MQVFGLGHDLCIYHECNTNNKNFSKLGNSYEVPLGVKNNKEDAESYIAGKQHFFILENEVYQVKSIEY